MELLQTNLLTPVVLAFVLGAIAARVGSDLRLPDPIYATLSIYLVFAIGLKGGASLSQSSLSEVALPGVAALLLGCATPVWCYALLRRTADLSREDAAALAAHYGSISIVTFMAGIAYLDSIQVEYEGFVPAFAAMLEVPGIAVALFLARRGSGKSSREGLIETLTGRSIVLLTGGLVIGLLSGPEGVEKVSAFFIDPFQGVLALFLLEMGRVASSRLGDLRQSGAVLMAFAIIGPAFHGLLGVALGWLTGLSEGGSFALGILSASASYIAAPAAVRLSLPEANPSVYLTPVLAVTFPFNLTLGIPLFHTFARWFHG
ncbi:MAG: sodium-dependent bicarbonate transport family permease [Myxococcota bacterium]|nr:sodium-dependent bicarbonate transport family permease [Myxococcota bacterium]